MINWTQLFQDEGVHYVTGGKNTSAGWISVKCPLCGSDDPSEHMGIHLSTGHWRCWRDAMHKGSSPVKFITILLGISKQSAQFLIEGYSDNSIDSFGVEETKQEVKSKVRPTLPKEFKTISYKSLTHKFWEYVLNRGFDDPDKVISQYDLKACLVGDYKGRLIIPVEDEKGLVGWQGRSLKNYDDVPKYLTSSSLIKTTIFNIQNTYGDVLFICEGPLDALKLDFYGRDIGIQATCLFGVNFTLDQIHKLNTLQHRYKRLIALFDNDSAGVIASFSLSDYLPQVEFGHLPDGVKDPGSMSKQQVLQMSM